MRLQLTSSYQYVNRSNKKLCRIAVKILVNKSAKFLVVSYLATLIVLEATASLQQ